VGGWILGVDIVGEMCFNDGQSQTARSWSEMPMKVVRGSTVVRYAMVVEAGPGDVVLPNGNILSCEVADWLRGLGVELPHPVGGKLPPPLDLEWPSDDTPAPKPQWNTCGGGDKIQFSLQSAASCVGVCGKVRCHFPCEYEHDGKCAVIRLLDEEDPDAPAGDVDYRCDTGVGSHLGAEDERTKANVQDCWRRRLALGETFRVEP